MRGVPQWRHRDGRPVDLPAAVANYVRACWYYGAAVVEHVRGAAVDYGAFNVSAGVHDFLYNLGADDHAGGYDDCPACHLDDGTGDDAAPAAG
jgi:hypothetical protein